MIKTILVPASGSSTDDTVFATALAAAQPLSAHLAFYHVRLSAIEAAERAPQAEFCAGGSLPVALNALREVESDLSQAAAAHVQSFCSRHSVPMRETPEQPGTVSASFLEEQNRARDRLMQHARHNDLIVLGRASHIDYLPSTLMEDLLVGSGRPILIAPDFLPTTLTGTVVLGWKETQESARAVGAALPLLEKAGKVILLHIVEREPAVSDSLKHHPRQLQWHGVAADIHVIAGGPHPLTYHLARAAAELRADLLVAGGFGHSRLRERAFGGVTRSLIEHANMPVFMVH
jgi:nucleotide-binding universal stress UspA family protein